MAASEGGRKKVKKDAEESGIGAVLTRLFGDPDEVFSYDTVKEVRVLDRRLGYIYFGVLTMVVFYVVVYVFMIKRSYLEFEKTAGWTVSKVLNPAYDEKGIPWDVFDSVTNPGENNAVFVPTRVLVTRGQTQEGFCESPMHTCSKNEDCEIGDLDLQKGECSNGRCMRRQWCPAPELGKPTTEEHLVHAENYAIWLTTNLHFHRFMLDVSTADERKTILFPAPGANTYSVKDFLRMAGVKLEDVQQLGALLQVSHMIHCDLTSASCSQSVQASNIDSKSGFNYKHSYTYFDNGVEKRDEYHFYGIRIICAATGFGQQASISAIVLQLSAGIAMLASAQTVADVVLQYMIPERRHYVELKVQETEDFNEDA